MLGEAGIVDGKIVGRAPRPVIGVAHTRVALGALVLLLLLTHAEVMYAFLRLKRGWVGGWVSE